jgi:hypothetical protein
MYPEEDCEGTSEPALDFRTDKYLSFFAVTVSILASSPNIEKYSLNSSKSSL